MGVTLEVGSDEMESFYEISVEYDFTLRIL